MNIKRILSGIIAFTVVISAMPVYSSDQFDRNLYAEAADIESSENQWKCGKNAVMTIDNGIAHISGTGIVYNYNETYEQPWKSIMADIHTLTVDEGITRLGDNLLDGASSLSTVILPSTLERIGFCTFQYCSSLESVVLPSSLNTIKSGAFINSGLRTVRFTGTEEQWNNVTKEDLYMVTDGVKFIFDTLSGKAGDSALWYCDKDSDTLHITGNGAIADQTQSGAPWIQLSDKVANVLISKDIDTIGSYAFSGMKKLSSVSLSNISSIRDYAFLDCPSLSQLMLPDDLSFIGKDALAANDGVKVFCTPGTSAEKAAKAAGIDCDTISGTCGASAAYAYNSGSATLTIFGSGAVDDYSDGSERPWDAIINDIRKVTITGSIDKIGKNAFSGAASLESLDLGNVKSIGEQAFANCPKLNTLVIPETMTYAAQSAFYDDIGITAIVIHDTFESAGQAAFFTAAANENTVIYYTGDADKWAGIKKAPDNSVLESAKLYTNIISGRYSDNIWWVFIPDNGELRIIGSGNMPASSPETAPWSEYDSSIRCVRISENISSVGDNAFAGMTSLEKVVLHDNITSIGNGSFRNCTLLSEINFGDSLRSVGTSAFSGCTSLGSVTLPAGFESVGDEAFADCAELSYIKIPENVKSIGSHAFFHCEKLNEIFVESADAEYGDKAFGYSAENRRKSDVQLITFAGSTAEKFASDNGIQLVSVKAGDSCGRDAVFTFDEESGVLSVYGRGETYDYNNGTNKAPWSAEGYVSSIKEVRFSSGITRIGNSFLQGAKSLTTISLPENLSSIGTQAFRDCSSVESVRFPDTVKTIGRNAFYGAQSLSKLFFEGDAPIIEGDASGAHRQFIDAYGTEIYAHFTKSGWSDFRENSGIRDDAVIIDLDTVSTYDKLTITNVPDVINVGEEIQLKIDIDPRIASEFIWTSSSPEIVQISNAGLLTSFGVGEAEITVKSKYNSDICFSFMIISKDAGSLKMGVKAEAVTLDGKIGIDNASANNYNYYTTFATRLVNSYFVKNNDGTFTRVENVDNSYILIEDYDKELKLISSRTMEMQLHHMLGYYHGNDGYHYFLFGQDNDGKYSQPAMDDELEVYRMVRYNADWSDPVTVKIDNTGASTVSLKDLSNGVARMTETDKYLYVTTARTVYQGHQENLVLVFKKDTMERIFDSAFYTRVSHSFNGFIDYDGDYIYLADHGDYNPRAVMVQRFPKNIFNIVGNKKLNVFDITVPDHPVYGDNYTGVTVGGFAASDSTTILAGTSIDQSLTEVDDQTQHNIFCTITDNALSSVKLIWLTDHPEKSGIDVYTPQLVKLNSNQFLVMWEECERKTKNISTFIAVIDQNGNIIGQPEKTDMRLSDCQPIVADDGTVMWYVTDDMAPVVYKVNPYSLEKADTSRITYVFDIDTATLHVSGKGNIPNYTAGSERDFIKQSGADPDKIKNIVIDGDVYKIGDNAFSDLKNLENVYFESDTYNIGDKAFADCPSLKEIVLPDTLKTVGNGVFDNDTAIKRIVVPESVEKADFGWMYAVPGTEIYYTGTQEQWDKLTSDLYDSTRELKHIVTGAVSGKCGNSAYYVYDPEKNALEIYGSGSIDTHKEKEYPWSSYSDKITSVHISEGITSVPDNAFLDSEKLEDIIISDSVSSVGKNAFAGTGSSFIIIHPQLKNIGDCSIGYDKELESRSDFVVYGTKDSAAEKYASDKKLKFIAVESYCGENLAWYFDSSTGTLNIVGTGDMYDFENKKQPWYSYKDKITSVNLPEGLTRIGNNAFNEFNKLNNAVIPESVREVGAGAFYSCCDLDTITIKTTDYRADETSFFDGYGKKRDIYFAGSEAQWNKVATGSEKTDAVTVHFNSDGPPPPAATTTSTTNATTTTTASKVTTTTAAVKTTSVTDTSVTSSTAKTSSSVTQSSAVKTTTASKVTTTTSGSSSGKTDETKTTASTISPASGTNASLTSSSAAEKNTSTSAVPKTTVSTAASATSSSSAATYTTTSGKAVTGSGSATHTASSSVTRTTTASVSSGTKKTTSASSVSTTSTVSASQTTSASTALPVNYLFGDVNLDGKVDASDASEILMAYTAYSVGAKPSLSDIQLRIADINGDRAIDASDATLVLMYYSYLSTGGKDSFEDYLKK